MSRRDFLRTAGVALGVFGTGSIYRGRAPDRSAGRTAAAGAAQTDASRSADYYVAPDGDDAASGTKQEPFATVEAAAADASPGETIHLRGGVYRREESITLADVRGTDEEPITIAGRPGERPVLEFDGPTPGGWDASGRDDGGLKFKGARHLTVRNLAVRDSPYLGIEVTDESRDNVFENISTYNNNLVGFGVYDGSNGNTLRNVVSANNYDPQNGGADADGIQISNARDNRVEGAKLYHNSDDGLDLWESRSNVVVRCVSSDNGRGESGDGNGFKLGGGGPSGGHVVRRNVAFDNSRSGFDYNEADAWMDVFNNTAWHNPTNFEFHDVTHHLKNNISSHGDVSIGSRVDDTHNTWNLDIDRARFASVYPNDSKFLHLQPNSPCIDRGTDVGLSYAGSAPDLGAHEFRPDDSS